MKNAGYTFMSISTAKPGRFDDLVRIAQEPPKAMEGRVEGLIAHQVSFNKEKNSVIVWSTYDQKESLYNYLASDEAKGKHGDREEMEQIIETFDMYDLEPVAGFLK